MYFKTLMKQLPKTWTIETTIQNILQKDDFSQEDVRIQRQALPHTIQMYFLYSTYMRFIGIND